MELRLLRYFVVLAEELHFGRAAQRLFIAQPSLSSQIRKLEQTVGTTLFDRTRHRVTLTPAGLAVLEPARRLLAAADDLPVLARDAAGGKGTLRVGYVPYARQDVLPALLDALRLVHPQASVLLRSGTDSPEVFGDLRDGRIDVAILRSPVSAPWLRTRRLAVEPFEAALPMEHPLALAPTVRLADLRDEVFALFPRTINAPAYDHLMGFFAEAGYRPTIGQDSRRMDDSLAFVASGGGVGLFPRSVARSAAEAGVIFRPLVDPTPVVEIVLGWDVNSLNPLVPLLSRNLRGLCSDQAPPLQPAAAAADGR